MGGEADEGGVAGQRGIFEMWKKKQELLAAGWQWERKELLLEGLNSFRGKQAAGAGEQLESECVSECMCGDSGEVEGV